VKSNSKKKKTKGIIISAVIGFAVAMILMAILIYFGYCTAYNSNVESMNVSMFGLNIYSLTKVGDSYNGLALGTNMGVICGIFIVVAIGIEQVITLISSR
jgi:uncharacterized membrane protein YccC